MVRSHSVIETVKLILAHNMFFGATRVGIVGNMGTGKSSQAMTIAHLAHKISDVPYAVKVFDKQGLLKFQDIVSNLEPANYIMIIDDASFLAAQASKQKMDVIKQDITEIRHFKNLEGKRIIIIINWHYEYGLDKFIRSTDFRYCTSVGISDTENLTKLVGIRYLQMVMQFQQMCVQATKEPYQFRFMLGKKSFDYNYRKPHIPLLFYDKHSLRFVVSPTRHFVDSICNLCSNAENKDVESDIETKHIIEKLNQTYGFGTVKVAMRAKLLGNGINVYPKRVKQCMRAIGEYFSQKIMNFEEIAEIYELKDEETKNRPRSMKRRIMSVALGFDLVKGIDKMVGFGSNRSELVEKILSDYLKQNGLLVNEESTSIELAHPIQQKKEYPEYDNWNYESIITELGNMAKLSVEEIDREKYEYLCQLAKKVVELKT